MRVLERKDIHGQTVAIEVSSLVGRNNLRRLFESIPDIDLRVLDYLPSDREEFLQLELRGNQFVVSEPFGDSSIYWIGPREFIRHSEIDEIAEFLRSRKMPLSVWWTIKSKTLLFFILAIFIIIKIYFSFNA